MGNRLKSRKAQNALILTGLARDFESAYPYLEKFILKPYRIEPHNIFISTWDDVGYWYPGDAANSSSFAKSGILTREKLRKVFKEAKIEIENFDSVKDHFEKQLVEIPETFREEFNHSNYLVRGVNLVSLFYKISRGLSLVEDQHFGKIIRTRLDLAPKSYIRDYFSNSFITLKQRNHLGGGTGDNLHIGELEQHLSIGRIYSELKSTFDNSDQILCPHLFVETALRVSGVRYRETNIRYSTFHTPGGQYKALNSQGIWVDAQESDYIRTKNPFKGK